MIFAKKYRKNYVKRYNKKPPIIREGDHAVVEGLLFRKPMRPGFVRLGLRCGCAATDS